MKRKCNKIFILFFSLLSLFLYSYCIEPNRLILRESDLRIPNWDANLNGLRVALIGDMHIGTKRVPISKVRQIVKLVNSQNPDVILIVGDFDSKAIVYSKIPPNQISKELSNLKSHYGTYAVLGNHDYEPAGIIEPILSDAGIKLLKDKSAYLYINQKRLRICGIHDIWHYKPNLNAIIGKVSEPTIFLSHNPDVFPDVPQNVSLTLSGHTHGGEIAFPFVGAPFIPSNYGQKYSKGYIVENNKHLFVTSGIGCLSRFRLLNTPEIVILNLYTQ